MLEISDFETSIKVIIVGNGSVGKTSMCRRFTKGKFSPDYKQTIGTAFSEKTHYVKQLNETVKFMVWDTAGQEEFDAVCRRYYRGAGAVILAFSTTDRASFQAVMKWNQKVEKECGKISTVLIQNKIDLLDQAVVTSEEAEDLARRLGVKFYRTSVKQNYNVDEVFDELATSYLTNYQNQNEFDIIDAIDMEEEEEEEEKPKVKNIKKEEKPLQTKGIKKIQQKEDKPNIIKLHDPSGVSKQRTGGKKHRLHWCKLL